MKYFLTKKNNKILFSLLIPFLYLSASGALISFEGLQLQPYTFKPEKSTGIDEIFVIDSVEGVSITYESNGQQSVEWLIYGNLGGGYAEPVRNLTVEGKLYTLNKIEGDRGYIINDNGASYIFWITDYSDKFFTVKSLEGSTDQDCMSTILDFEGYAAPIYYYTINGRQEVLSRDIELNYNTLYWNEDQSNFLNISESKILPYCNSQITVTPPNYCNTLFKISGDRFLEFWGKANSITSGIVQAYAVDVSTEATQDFKEDSMPSNQINSDGNGLGGSAPATINFVSYVTDAVEHFEWEMAEDNDFNYVVNRFYDQDFSYTFTEEGVTYVRFIGSNYDGSCEVIGDTYTVSIGGSELLIPNAFTPNDDGTNDVWRVSYRSLIEFKCWIFDRHGHQLYFFDDPSGGWDGKRNGKTVKSGVYFYVIQAKGSDGRVYKESGDINILNYKGNKGNYSEE